MAVPPRSRRWQLMAAEFTDAQPSPVAARQSMGSTVLQRRSSAAQRLQQRMTDLDKVVSSTSQSRPAVHTPSLTYTPGSLFKDSFRQDGRAQLATPPSNIPDEDLDATLVNKSSLSIMDETGFSLSHSLYLHHTPTHNMTTIASPQAHASRQDTTMFDTTSLTSSLPEPVLIEDITKHVADDVVKSFHRCVSEYQSPDQVLELCAAFRESCRVQIEDLKSSGVHKKSSQYSVMMMDLVMEKNVWELAEVLFTDRLVTETQDEEEMEEEKGKVKHQTDKQIAEDFFMNNRDVRQAQLIVDWLEQIETNNLEDYPMKAKYFADSICWENTLHDIKHGVNKENLITEMDPDAPTRQNKHLADLDERDEESLMKHLFILVRAGQLQKAQELCVECKQPWRATTLEGWKLYHDPNLNKRAGDELEPVEGNIGHDLWKMSCWEMAKDPMYSAHEKAIYAALSGNLQQLLPACVSWYDCVWAYFKVIVDILVEQKLQTSMRCPSILGPQALPDEYWNSLCLPQQIFQNIEAIPSELIQQQSKFLFHIVEKHIITGQLDDLVEMMYTALETGDHWTQLHKLRFMAHVVLFVRHLGYDFLQTNDIMRAYVEKLIHTDLTDLVALYCTFLPPADQVSCYAKMLEKVTKPEQQKQCLQLAKDAGLDVAAITKTVVETVRKRGMELHVPLKGNMELGQETGITESDRAKIEVFSWLVFEESHRAEAVHQANALIREFLAVRKYSAAHHVFNMLPADSIEVVTRHWKMTAGENPFPLRLANDIREYLHIEAYLDAHDYFANWLHNFHQKPVAPVDHNQPLTSLTEQIAMEQRLKQYQEELKLWSNQNETLTAEVITKIYNVLLFVDGGWMRDNQEGGDDGSEEEGLRRRQMAFLRQLCLPQLCFLLHNVLHSTQQYQKCMEIANVIASEQHQLYKVFHQDELQRLLHLLHSSSLCMLESPDCDPLGYELAV